MTLQTFSNKKLNFICFLTFISVLGIKNRFFWVFWGKISPILQIEIGKIFSGQRNILIKKSKIPDSHHKQINFAIQIVLYIVYICTENLRKSDFNFKGTNYGIKMLVIHFLIRFKL